MGFYIPKPNPSSLTSILGPYVPKPSPSSLPYILGPYIPPSIIPITLTSNSFHPIINQDQPRHTSLKPFQHPNYINPSIRYPYHSSPSTNHVALGSNLDAKYKMHKAKNPQKLKDQHVPSKIHATTKKNMIQNQKIKSQSPQRPMNKKSKSKTMWILKIIIELMHPKEKSKLASKIAYLKASSNPKSLTPSNNPSSPPSILGPYIPKSSSTPPYKPQNPSFLIHFHPLSIIILNPHPLLSSLISIIIIILIQSSFQPTPIPTKS